MNPHGLARLSADELSSLFCKALQGNDLQAANGVFVQLESRFHRQYGSPEESRRFVDDFLMLTGRPEVRSLHLDDPFARYVARIEHLLELAGERARTVTDEAILRQIVDSRERGMDLIRVLAAAPAQGLSAGELAGRLETTPQNLSPLLSAFHAHGIVDRERRGRNVYVTLTRQGRSLFAPESAPARREPEYRFLSRPLKGVKEFAA